MKLLKPTSFTNFSAATATDRFTAVGPVPCAVAASRPGRVSRWDDSRSWESSSAAAATTWFQADFMGTSCVYMYMCIYIYGSIHRYLILILWRIIIAYRVDFMGLSFERIEQITNNNFRLKCGFPSSRMLIPNMLGDTLGNCWTGMGGSHWFVHRLGVKKMIIDK